MQRLAIRKYCCGTVPRSRTKRLQTVLATMVRCHRIPTVPPCLQAHLHGTCRSGVRNADETPRHTGLFRRGAPESVLLFPRLRTLSAASPALCQTLPGYLQDFLHRFLPMNTFILYPGAYFVNRQFAVSYCPANRISPLLLSRMTNQNGLSAVKVRTSSGREGMAAPASVMAAVTAAASVPFSSTAM